MAQSIFLNLHHYTDLIIWNKGEFIYSNAGDIIMINKYEVESQSSLQAKKFKLIYSNIETYQKIRKSPRRLNVFKGILELLPRFGLGTSSLPTRFSLFLSIVCFHKIFTMPISQ